ncbi:MAG: cell division protein FtsQ/DivIB [Dialister sp.]|nr:cell division protein FtsQ/DivIB [Dialister sp.]
MDEFKTFKQFQKESRQGDEPHFPAEDENASAISENGALEQKTKSARRRARSRIHLRAGAYGVLFFACLLLILLALLFLPVPFGYITLYNTTALTEDDVLFDGNIRRPINVLQISTSDLEERLSHDLRVQTVRVARESPFSIGVDIADSRPIAVVQGEFLYVVLDESGRVIEADSAIKQLNVPFITGKKLGNALLGETVTDEDVQKALSFIKKLSPEGEKVFSEVNIGHPDNIAAYTRSGITVRLGNGDRIEEQAVLAENMVGDIKARDLSVEYIDANISAPFIKLRR